MLEFSNCQEQPDHETNPIASPTQQLRDIYSTEITARNFQQYIFHKLQLLQIIHLFAESYWVLCNLYGDTIHSALI